MPGILGCRAEGFRRVHGRRLRPSASSLPDGAGTRGLPGRPEARIPEGGSPSSAPREPAASPLAADDGDSIRSSLCLPLERRTRVFLGIDIGSISTNIVLMDENREVVAKYYLMDRQPSHRGGADGVPGYP